MSGSVPDSVVPDSAVSDSSASDSSASGSSASDTSASDSSGVSGQHRLTHLDETGAARMVDVSAKDVTARTARASGRVRVSAAVVRLLREPPGAGGLPKGDTAG